MLVTKSPLVGRCVMRERAVLPRLDPVPVHRALDGVAGTLEGTTAVEEAPPADLPTFRPEASTGPRPERVPSPKVSSMSLIVVSLP
ncbi:MAG: hypothetical protein JWM50_220 [Microbacteriaceae bacterium]|jgi:hypothetical protein|nr:hypothetical protein [Microbacteriaceae bacterium]